MRSPDDFLSVVQELREAIESRWPVTIRYEKPGGAMGERYGFPYVLHSQRRAFDGAEMLYLTFYQLAGDSSNHQGVPGIRTLLMEHVVLEVVHLEDTFEPPALTRSAYGTCIAIAE